MLQIKKETIRKMKISSAKHNAQEIYDSFCILLGTNQHIAEEILEMTGLVNEKRPVSSPFKLEPVADDLSDESLEDLCSLLVDIKDQKICMKKIGKLNAYASPEAYMDFVA